MEKYFGGVSSVSEINLDVIRVDCPANEDGEPLEEVIIESGKTLTITTTRDYVRYASGMSMCHRVLSEVVGGKTLRRTCHLVLVNYYVTSGATRAVC